MSFLLLEHLAFNDVAVSYLDKHSAHDEALYLGYDERALNLRVTSVAVSLCDAKFCENLIYLDFDH